MNSIPVRSSTLLLWFIVVWTTINLLQAATLDVDADEAYYWLYASKLSWGYFDHPPLVALLVRFGESFGHGPFFTRLGTVLLSAGSVYFGFRMLPAQQRNLSLYLLIFASIILFHVYGFITTPDSCLLFFTTLFFFRYKKYLHEQSLPNTLWLAFSIAGMLYSKYHGVLPVAFVFLSNPKLILKPSAWLIAGLVTAAFLPHLYWQYNHNWPTFRYHLYERVSGDYTVDKTVNYILTQLFIWGPLTTIPALYFRLKQKRQIDTYLRAHAFNFFGIFLFFFLSSFRFSVEGHWILVAGPSFVVLLHQVTSSASAKTQKLLRRLLRINIGLILLLRVVLFLPNSLLAPIEGLHAVVFGRQWADDIYKQAAGKPVVFANSYAWPALYKYYHPAEQTIGFSTATYRKSQYSLNKADTLLHNQNVLLASPDKLKEEAAEVRNPFINLYLLPFKNFQAVTPLEIVWDAPTKKITAGKPLETAITLTNTGVDTVYTENLLLGSIFVKAWEEKYPSVNNLPFSDKFFPPGYTKQLRLILESPVKKGDYYLIFTVVQPPLAGSFGSGFYKIKVE